MGNRKGAYIAEDRVYDNPSDPEHSDYDVRLPVTVPKAVINPDTGETVEDMIRGMEEAVGNHATYTEAKVVDSTGFTGTGRWSRIVRFSSGLTLFAVNIQSNSEAATIKSTSFPLLATIPVGYRPTGYASNVRMPAEFKYRTTRFSTGILDIGSDGRIYADPLDSSGNGYSYCGCVGVYMS